MLRLRILQVLINAYWEDRYHATAIESGEHLLRCLVYIDMNMIRAGVVAHPSQWAHSGYHEIQSPPLRYALVNQQKLIALSGAVDGGHLRVMHRKWVDQAIADDKHARDSSWSHTVAVGSPGFVVGVKEVMRYEGVGRNVQPAGENHILREPEKAFTYAI